MSDVARSVPCNGCTLCCRHEIIWLHEDEGDDPRQYEGFTETLETPYGQQIVLKHKTGGDCIFLGDVGCTVYNKRPVICREFDCRRAYLKLATCTRRQRRIMIKKGMIDPAVYDRGRELVPTLDPVGL